MTRVSDPKGASRDCAAKEKEMLLSSLGSEKLRVTRIDTLRRALYATRPDRFVGVNYKKDNEVQAHYTNTVLPELYDAVIHIEHTHALVPLDVTSEWRRGLQETGYADQT